jgi:hypothetical protein
MKWDKLNITILSVPIVLSAVALYGLLGGAYAYHTEIRPISPIFGYIVALGAGAFLGFVAFWTAMVYLIALLRDNEELLKKNSDLLQANLEKYTEIGSKHLKEARDLIAQVLGILRKYE